jgi:hypothetical protein
LANKDRREQEFGPDKNLFQTMTENFARQEYQLTLEELRRLPHLVRQNAYGQVLYHGHMGIADAWAAALCSSPASVLH